MHGLVAAAELSPPGHPTQDPRTHAAFEDVGIPLCRTAAGRGLRGGPCVTTLHGMRYRLLSSTLWANVPAAARCASCHHIVTGYGPHQP